MPGERSALPGDCQEFRVCAGEPFTDQACALVSAVEEDRELLFAMAHSRGGILQSFSLRFKTRNSSFIAASSLGQWPLARTARRSLAFRASMAFVV